MEVLLGYTVSLVGFLLGPALASYFTVLVMRGENLTKARGSFSVDDHTGERLKWFEMIPVVSFILLRGKSRYSRKPLDVRMFLAELIATIAFAILTTGIVRQLGMASAQGFSMFEFLLNYFIIYFFTAALLYLAIYDIFTYSIPARFTLLLSLGAIGLNLVVGLAKLLPGNFLQSLTFGEIDNLIAALIAGLAVWSVIRLTKQKGMGEGDTYIAVVMGAMLGGSNLIAAFYITIFAGTLIGIWMMWKQKRFRGIVVPLVPFMLFGYVAGAVWGQQIMNLLFSGLL